LSILCPNLRIKPNDRWNRTSFAPSPSQEKSSASSSLLLGEREPTENPAHSTAHLLLSGRFDNCPDIGGTYPFSGSRGVGLCEPSPGGQRPHARNLTEIRNGPMIPTRPARWSRPTCGCGTACMREDPAMTVIGERVT